MSTLIAAAALATALALGAGPPRPLTLAEAIDVALASAPEVAAHQVAAERARLQTLRANLERIHVSVDATTSALAVSPPFLTTSGGAASHGAFLPLASLEASAGAPLFSGFRISANVARAEHLERAVTADLAAERLAVALAVARAYWGERRLALLEGAQRAAAEQLHESERVIQARVAAGLAAGLDADRAAARRVQLEVEAATLAAQRREARARLAVLLGVDDDVELVDDPVALTGEHAVDEGADAAVQRALDGRPELRAAHWRARALHEEQRMHESAYWPQLDLGALAQLGNNPALAGVGSRAVTGVNGDAQVGLSLRMNLFDTFATTHAVDDVVHRQRLAELERRALARSIESDVRVPHARVTSLAEQRAALVKARDLMAGNLATLLRVYGNGDVPFTEVLDAQVALADAERHIVGVDAELVLARLELAAATGAWAPWAAGTAALADVRGKAGNAS